MLQPGDKVPDFTSTDQHGNPVRFSDVLAAGPTVIFFYPKAMTTGCTKESCHFRDLDGEFRAAGAQRVGISADSVAKQAQFDQKHGLGYTLLSDSDKTVAKIFGVKRPGPLMSKRTTFVVDSDSTVLEVIGSELNMDIHADRALEVLAARAGG